jgi:hypothetical protein
VHFENGRPSRFSIPVKARGALAHAGIEFTGEEPGVRLKRAEGR